MSTPTTPSTKVMKPTAEILTIAKNKAATLLMNTQIRVGGGEYEKSYWVFNFAGTSYIGSLETEKLPDFFKGKQVYEMRDKNNVLNGTMQILNK